MINFLLQIMVLYPLVSWIQRKVGSSKSSKFVSSIAVIIAFASIEFLSILQAWEPSLYETLSLAWDTPLEQMKWKQWEASLKYHPDKLKGEDKIKYADVFINLNFYFDSLTKFKHNYDYFGIQVDEETREGTE